MMDQGDFPQFIPVGETAVAGVFGAQIDPQVNQRVHALANAAKAKLLPGIGELVPSYASLLIHFDPLLLDPPQVLAWAAGLVQPDGPAAEIPARLHVIPVIYGGTYGPDLADLAAQHGLTEDEAIALHSGREYRVYMIGFTPGFPYLGSVDERIATPRRSEPRVRVPAGSVGIAGAQTGIYPVESPGGWQVIGYTPLRLFDPQADPPSLLAPGDRVRFQAIRPDELPHDA